MINRRQFVRTLTIATVAEASGGGVTNAGFGKVGAGKVAECARMT